MAEGLIKQSRDNERLEDLGGEYFYELLSRSLFQASSNDRTKFIMHDSVNDLAQLVSQKMSFRLEDASKTNTRLKRLEGTCYSSYVCYRYNCRSRFEVFNNVEHLRTLLPMPPINDFATIRYMSHNVLLHMLSRFKKLRVFSLRNFYIVELLDSIIGLRHLRYLDLSESKIKILPESINSLYNLQTLLLRNCCCLLKLPTNVGNLINLRHLDMLGASLIKLMPLGMRMLKYLQILSNFIVGEGSGSSVKDLKSLRFLRGKLHISKLENAINLQDTREIILSNKEDLGSLVLEWKSQFDDTRDMEVEEDALEKLQPHKSIKELTIICYGGTKFPSWIRDPSFPKVTVIKLVRCEKCTFLPSLGLLGSLKNLTINGMKELKRIGSKFLGKGCLRPFPSLETLCFESLEEWEYWESIQENEHVESFISLCELHIIRCPKLSERLPGYLFSLEKLVIHKCAQLLISFSNIPFLCEVDIDECKKILCNTPTDSKSLKSVTLSNISDFGNWLRHEFQKVECLRIKGCEELRNLWQNEISLENPAQGLQTLSYLRELRIENCSSLTSLPERIKDNNAHLEKLYIEGCHSLTLVFRGSLPPSLKRIEIKNCRNLQCMLDSEEDNSAALYCSSTALMDNESVKISTSLLEYLIIKACPSLTCLSTVQLPAVLTHLIIRNCSKLKTFLPAGQLPIALKYLEVEECSELTTLSSISQLPETFETLIIEKCPRLESVVERFPIKYLNHISTCECENLKYILEGLHTLTGLRKIKIWECPSLVSFPEGGFPNTDLSVSIRGCEKLKALPNQMHTLTCLGELSLYRCPSMSFPEEGFPTNIISLTIEGLNLYKPLTEWGLQQLINLRELSIFGCLDAVSFPEVEMPPTLTYLWIEKFPNLKNLSSKGFQNLSSLETLWIYDCPKLASLPSLPPSFLQLYIGDCPLLKKRCKKDKGKEWSKIVDIPYIYIDSKFFCEE